MKYLDDALYQYHTIHHQFQFSECIILQHRLHVYIRARVYQISRSNITNHPCLIGHNASNEAINNGESTMNPDHHPLYSYLGPMRIASIRAEASCRLAVTLNSFPTENTRPQNLHLANIIPFHSTLKPSEDSVSIVKI